MKLFYISLFIFLCSSVPVSASQDDLKPALEYAYPDVSVWTTKRTPYGNLDNPLLRLATNLFWEVGIDFTAAPYPAKRMFQRLIYGESQFSMLVRAPQLLKGCCLVSEKPVAVVELRAFHSKKFPKIIERADFIGKRVILIRGYSYAGLTKYIKAKNSQVKYTVAPDHKKAFELLKRGRGEYVIDYARPADEILKEVSIKGLTYSTLKQSDIHMFLHKSFPNAPEVMTKLEKAAAKLDTKWFKQQPQLQ
jgi:hypothetical protein